ncbi:MAG: PQQ-binding-like beta-propeller repeat protein [Candidatus Micrarchaeota archaeon]|nr:PQQ-binding-like beta-propeller repeat protein [Candidatus Micrarchaeota archaeon]
MFRFAPAFFLIAILPISFCTVIWSQSASDAITGKPALFSDKLVFTSADGKIYALSAQSGAIAWSYDLGERAAFPAHKLDESKIAAVGVKGKLAVIGVADGVPIATASLLSAPKAFAAGDGKAFVATNDSLIAYTPQGKRAWNLTKEGIVGQMGIGEGSLYFVSSGRLYSASTGSGAIKWSAPAHQTFLSRPAEYAGAVYVGGTDGHLYSFDASTGSLRWRFKTGGWVASSPLPTADGVYFVSNDGNAYAVSQSGQLLFKTPIKPSWAQPAVYTGKGRRTVVFADSEGKLYGADASTGELIWSFFSYGTPEDLAMHSGNIAFGTSKGKMYLLSPSAMCSFSYPENLGIVGGWVVEVEGAASADAGIEQVEVRASSPGKQGSWEAAFGKESWHMPIDFARFESGPVKLECRVRDSGGRTDTRDFSSITLIKDDNAPLLKMFAEYPSEVEANEEFFFSAKDERGKHLRNVKLVVGGIESVGESPFTIKLASPGKVAITAEKAGFEPIAADVKVRGGTDYATIILGAALVVAIGYFLAKKMKKK